MQAYARVPEERTGEFLSKAQLNSLSSSKGEYVTRGEFVIMASGLLGIYGMESVGTLYDYTPFDDVTKDKKEFYAVAALYSMGIIKGYGTNTFRTDDYITSEEVAIILIRLLGLEAYAESQSYMFVAGHKDLFKNVSANKNGYITYSDAQDMLYNALEADISESELLEGSNKGGSYMSKRLGIYKLKGCVTDDGITSLYGESAIRESQIKIDNNVYENKSGISSADIIGYTVEAYYRKNNDGDNEIFFIYVNEISNGVIEIKADDIKEYTNLKYSYYTNREYDIYKTASVSNNYRLIYNGALYSPSTASKDFTLTMDEMLAPKSGSVKLIDADNNGKYETVIVKNYEMIFVKSFDSDNLIIIGNSVVTPKTISLKEAEGNITYKTHLGAVGDKGLILTDSVVSVARSADGKKAEVIISTKKADGTVFLTSDNIGERYSVKDEIYKLTDEYISYLSKGSQIEKSSPQSGDDCILYLTFENKVAFAEITGGESLIYALLINAQKQKTLSSSPQLQLLTDNNEYGGFEIAEKIKMNDKTYNDPDKVIDYLIKDNDFTVTGQFGGLIGIKLNSENVIISIDTPYDEDSGNPNSDTESENSMHRLKGCRTTGKQSLVCNYYSENYNFHNFFVGTGSTTCFYIPYNADNIYESSLATNLSDTTSVTVSGYADVIPFSIKAGSLTADVILSYRDSLFQSLRNGTELYLVTKVIDSLGKEGDKVKRITFTNGYMMFEHDTESAASLVCGCGCQREVQAGDVIRCVKDASGIIPNGGTFIHYDFSEEKMIASSIEAKHGTVRLGDPSYFTSLTGYVNSIENNSVMEYYVDFNPFTAYYNYYRNDDMGFNNRPATGTYNERQAYPIHQAYYVEFDKNTGKWKNLTMSDLKQYEDGNGIMEKSVLLLRNSSPYCVIVYR